ncbi:MAG: LPXTG cell wall anchor domain-containing protein [Clostridia bacterium]|nr:LPXTG cell wall anchor domain-containing protein [Clostridia bacterium]
MFIDGELIEENDSVYEFTFYNKQIPKIQTGTELNRTLLMVSAIISLLGIGTGIVVLKKKKQENN